MKHPRSTLVLTTLLATLLTTTTYAASKHQPSITQTHYDAMEKCISQTLEALPGTPSQGNGLSERRRAMYMECARKAGFKP
jgi:hypothetical protein